MLHFLVDLIPVLLFFIAFKLYGIYVATVVGIGATALQVVFTYIVKHKIDKQQFLTLVVFCLFGGMTLYFHNPLFVKWKPTVVFWIFGLIFMLSHFIGKKPIIQRMMEPALEGKENLPSSLWTRLNISWVAFFILMGVINIYVAYHYSTDAWVNFKLYGITGLFIAFSAIQAVCLSRHVKL